jgi:hypothetical protein
MVWGAPALLSLVVVVLLARPISAAEEIIAGEVIIEATGLRPSVLMTESEHRVIFVNRSGRMVHVDFMIRDPELHHVIQVPDQIWAIFHRPGSHPYEVHFRDPTVADLHGVIEVAGDPYGRPDPLVCSGVTVQGACIER